MLSGFRAMDEHFRTAPFGMNLPILLGLLTVWYNNFFEAQTVGIMPYSAALARFPAYFAANIGEARRAGKVICRIAGELMSNVCRPFSMLMHLRPDK
jgi:glucose-6-phosphate isomerase